MSIKTRLLASVLGAVMLMSACGESSSDSSPQKTESSVSASQTVTTTTVAETTTTASAETTTTASTTVSAESTTTTASTTVSVQTTSSTESKATTASTAKQEAPNDAVTQLMSQMTLEEKVAQLFIVRADALAANKKQSGGVTVCSADIKATLRQYPVGGVIYFADNVKDPAQLKKLSSDLQAASKYPLFITTDEEGGSVTRIAQDRDFKVTKFSSMLSVGSTGDPKQAENVGQSVGKYLKDYGLNLDLAPVADVFSNPNNKVIGNRAFGSDANSVSLMVSACVKGFHSQGVMTCLKHYPGHGDTSADSHYGTVTVKRTWNELLGRELIPFIGSLKDTDMVMAAHINLPNVTGDSTPASLSKVMITDTLRGELGYNGVIITDSLGMGAVTRICPASEVGVKVLEAGGDILLCPTSLPTAYKGVLDAVKSGRLSKERIDESVRRILELKHKYGLF